MKIQEYLRSGKTPENLKEEFGIKMQRHETLPLAIFNYDQIDSPKTNDIVREARGLVLRTDTYDLVARGFARFFNWGEVADELGLFDFSDFVVNTKEDGSYVLLYFFDGNWMANTRGSFAQTKLDYQNFTWQEGFCKALKIGDLQELKGRLDESLTYVCEFCSPFNKIVRRYPEPVMYLLTAFKGEHELHYKIVDSLVGDLFLRPARHEFTSIEEIQDFLNTLSETDPTYEGVVICDKDGRRLKIKSLTYLGLHRLKGESDSLFHPKHLIPFVLGGDTAELFTYFEETRPYVEKMQTQVDQWKRELDELWDATKPDETQKEYALRVKHHPLSSILFQARKQNKKPSSMFREFSDILLKHF